MRWLFICLLFFIVSCSTNERASRYYTFTGEEWEREECAEFEIKLENSAQYNMNIALRHNIDFPYREIWCAVAMRSDSADWYVDTVKIQMTDSLGYWLSNGNSLKTVKRALHNGKIYFHKGVVRVRIEHLGDSTIPGVRAVGVEFRVRSEELGVKSEELGVRSEQ